MHYEIETEPTAGQKFSFIAHDVAERAHFQFYVDDNLVKESGCDDPPCHEFLDIYYEAAGAILKVRGSDRSGEYWMQWEIGDTPMSIGGRHPRFIEGPVLLTK